jgi:hypothetical protein
MRTLRSIVLLALAPFSFMLAACGGEVQAHPNTAVEEGGNSKPSSTSQSTPGPDRKRPWWKPPGPIAGKWKTSGNPSDMVVEITVSGKNATGRVILPADGAKRHYAAGEEVLTLQVDDFGQWIGQLRKKTLAGVDKKEPIRFVATESVLDAIMTTDDAWKHMTRVD